MYLIKLDSTKNDVVKIFFLSLLYQNWKQSIHQLERPPNIAAPVAQDPTGALRIGSSFSFFNRWMLLNYFIKEDSP